MTELLEMKMLDKLPQLSIMKTHSRNLSLGGQSTPLSHKITASPKVASALASTLNKKASLLSELGPDLAVDFRFEYLSSYAHSSTQIFLQGLEGCLVLPDLPCICKLMLWHFKWVCKSAYVNPRTWQNTKLSSWWEGACAFHSQMLHSLHSSRLYFILVAMLGCKVSLWYEILIALACC